MIRYSIIKSMAAQWRGGEGAMQGMQTGQGEACPFTFNFDPACFAVGDLVSYRVPALGDFPFVGRLLEVHADHVLLEHEGVPEERHRATRESRPMVIE